MTRPGIYLRQRNALDRIRKPSAVQADTETTWELCRPSSRPTHRPCTPTPSHPTFASLMPAEQSVPTQPQPDDLDLSREQIKVCMFCRAPVLSSDADYPTHQLLIEPDIPLLCAGCRETRTIPLRQQHPISAGGRGSFGGSELVRPVLQVPPDGPSPIPFSTSQTHPSTSPLDAPELSRSISMSSEPNTYLPRISDKIHHAPKVKIQTDNPYPISRTASSESSQSQKEVRHEAVYSPNPLVDITRLRVRSPTHHCLYPGAMFTGTQKSGRSSYDVNVTIVVRVSTSLSWSPESNLAQDVDFSSSFLCGYLRIRGLTEDWPELTTYFDAEIIGSRYGFLTRNWGATEQEDMVHWQRFPAFRHVKNELKRPYLTMPENDRGAVFMRWKERFLVPDHRVQDINGASFAGRSLPVYPWSNPLTFRKTYRRVLLRLRRFQSTATDSSVPSHATHS